MKEGIAYEFYNLCNAIDTTQNLMSQYLKEQTKTLTWDVCLQHS